MHLDETESIRRTRLVEINGAVESHCQEAERKRLEKQLRTVRANGDWDKYWTELAKN